jgi:hypothetical protein
MKIVKFCLMTVLVLGLPFAAGAQQKVAKATQMDIHYCHALSLAWQGMISDLEAPPVGDVIVLGECDTDTEKAIPKLERMLKDQKVELPPRGIARAPAQTSETPCRGEPTTTSCVPFL